MLRHQNRSLIAIVWNAVRKMINISAYCSKGEVKGEANKSYKNVSPDTGESNDALWICLICGHIGCSRYHQGHAFQHYRETHHCYAMQLGNNRVWDYVGDNFVHRLLQNKDGKMVEGGPTATKAEGAAMEEKVDSVQLEFIYLLTSQLETQRQYFEERLGRLEQHSVVQTTELREKLSQISEENAKVKVIGLDLILSSRDYLRFNIFMGIQR